MPVTVHQAKTNLSKMLAAVERGEEFIIARGSKPVARLGPIEPSKPDPEPQPKPRRVPGRLAGKIALTDAFFEPLPDDELALWNGEGTCDCAFCSTPTP